MTASAVVIVGASLAGSTVAVRLRRLGHDGPITLVGAEAHLPYARPELSKGYLNGAVAAAGLLVNPPEAYDELDIGLRLGTPARGLDLDRSRVLLDADVVPYDVVVVATGSANIRPRIAGIDLRGVHQLRTIDDADGLRREVASGGQAVVVGAGFVGCEVASSLKQLGREVTLVDALPGPLWNVLGPEASAIVRGWHQAHGVGFLGDVPVAALEGSTRVEAVRLEGGRRLAASVVVVGVGARPALGWLDSVPLRRAAGGLIVDGVGRTSAANVYAVGDAAAGFAGGERETGLDGHYAAAIEDADATANAIVGREAPARQPPWFWSDQYEHSLHYTGRHRPTDARLLRSDGSAAFYLRNGKSLVAAVTINNGRDMRRAMRLLGREVDTTRLADPATDLRTLA